MSILILRSSVAAPTFDYYIGPSGSDSNPGTLGSPWAITSLLSSQSGSATTQSKANRDLMKGKRVGLLDGTYYLATYATGINDPDRILLNPPSGTVGAPTVIQAVNARQAILDGTDGSGNRVNTYYSSGCGLIGQSYLEAASGSVNYHNGYVELRGLHIRNGYRYMVHWRYSGALQDGPRYSGNVVDSCEIHDINFTGGGTGNNISLIEGYNCDGLTVSNCKIYLARGDSGSEANGYGIQTWCCNNSVFEYNSITDVKDAIYVKHTYQTGVIARYNYIDLSGYTGGGVTNAFLGMEFSSPGVQHANIHHNVAKADDGWKVHETGTILQGPCQFWNNTIALTGSAAGGTTGIQGYGSTQPIDIYNNIVDRSGTAPEHGDVAVNVGDTGHVDYNRYPASPKLCSANSTNSYPDDSYSSVASFTAARGFDTHSSAGSPGFVGSGAGALYYQLGGGSACINAGKSDGTTGGTTCDIGAWGNSPPARIGCNF